MNTLNRTKTTTNPMSSNKANKTLPSKFYRTMTIKSPRENYNFSKTLRTEPQSPKRYIPQSAKKTLNNTLTEENQKLCQRLKSHELKYSDNPYSLTNRITLSPRREIKNDLFSTLNNQHEEIEERMQRLNELSEIKLRFVDDLSPSKTLSPKKKGVLDNYPNRSLKNEFDIPSKYICFICHKLINDPVCCYKCNMNFCKECIENFINENQKCPKCLNLIFTKMLKPLDFSKEYKKISVECPYEGCKERFKLNEIKAHMADCIFKEKIYSDNKDDKPISFKRYDFKDDPYIKSRILEYTKTWNKSSVDNFTSISTDAMEQKRRLMLLNSNKPLKENDKKELTSIHKEFVKLNTNLENDMAEIAKEIKKTNDTIKTLLKKNHLQ